MLLKGWRRGACRCQVVQPEIRARRNVFHRDKHADLG
jgi:hypothetical protein